MTVDFRSMARSHLSDAREALEQHSPSTLRSAALSLRMSMEALTYERAKLYADDLSAEEYETWQPRKLMRILLEIDPHADATCGLSYGIEPSPSEAPEKMTFLGTENVLNLKTIKAHYDTFGSFLHVPTLKQINTGEVQDNVKLRERCEACAAAIEACLASPVWNVNFNHSCEIECVECGKTIRRRFRPGQDARMVACHHCDCEYRMSETPEKQIHWDPLQTKISCPNQDCDHAFYLLNKDVKAGTCWQCEGCGKPFILKLAIAPDPRAGVDAS